MSTNSRTTKNRGRKTARAVAAPLVLSLAFVAMTGLAPQQAAAQIDITASLDTAGDYNKISNADDTRTGDEAGHNSTFRVNTGGTVDYVGPAAPATNVSSTFGLLNLAVGGDDILVNGGTATGTFNGGGVTAIMANGFTTATALESFGSDGNSGGAGGNDNATDGADNTGVGGSSTIHLGAVGSYGTITVNGGDAGHGGAGGNGGTTAAGGAGGDAGNGGSATLDDLDVPNSLTIISGNMAVTSGLGGNGGNGGTTNTNAGGAGGNGGIGGDAIVDIDGTVRFVENNPLPASDTHALAITRSINGATGTPNDGGAGTLGRGGDVHVDINTLEANATTVSMVLTNMQYGYTRGPATLNDNVDIGTLRLISGGLNNGATFTTTSNVGLAAAYGTTGTHYTVDNLHVAGLNNTWGTNGLYTPGTGDVLTDGDLTFDVTGVHLDPTRNPTMLTMTDGATVPPRERVSFAGFGATLDPRGRIVANPNLVVTAANKAEHRAIIGETITLIDGVDGGGWDTSQWGDIVTTGGRTADTVRYYHQIGGSKFFYDTYGLDGDATPDMLNALAAGEINIGKAYSQYQAAAAETAADIFLNNTWVANRDVADIALPGTFALTGRVSYFTINQDQGHSSEADKDQLAAAIAGGFKAENGAGETTFGAFFEYGHGEYDTDTTVRGWGNTWGARIPALTPGSDKLWGDGDADLYGGGVFVYHDFLEGTYLDLGARYGQVDQTFRIKGHDLTTRGTKIDTDTSYWGLNFGVGHKFQLTNCANLDLYGKFLWTRLEDQDYRNGYGERISMDEVDSIRTRIGARINQGLGEGDVSVYYGAAWEQEWDGEATGRYDGVKIRDAADNSGASGFGEVGLAFKPQGQNFAVEVGAFGLVGQQQGGGGTIGLKFDF